MGLASQRLEYLDGQLLYSTLRHNSNRWSCFKTGEMWSRQRAPVNRLKLETDLFYHELNSTWVWWRWITNCFLITIRTCFIFAAKRTRKLKRSTERRGVSIESMSSWSIRESRVWLHRSSSSVSSGNCVVGCIDVDVDVRKKTKQIGVSFSYVYTCTALHGMQTWSSDENSVRLSLCLSVRPSVCLTNACVVTKRKKNLSKFLYLQKKSVQIFIPTKDHLA